jgi:hypothetical protein
MIISQSYLIVNCLQNCKLYVIVLKKLSIKKMSNHIRVTNLENKSRWQKTLSNEEFEQVKLFCVRRKSIGPFSAILKPVRTNNAKNFVKDFFLPTTLNQSAKVKQLAVKTFAVIAALFMDLPTIPIRALTCIPRMRINAKLEEHPMLTYLKGQGADKSLLKSDKIRIKLIWQTPTPDFVTWTAGDGARHKIYSRKEHYQIQDLNFIEVPHYGMMNESGSKNIANVHEII